MRLPDGTLVAWYGDDFTGSAAVMEEFAFAGIESVLFLTPPTGEQLARFSTARCIGLAGTARSHGPHWMEENLAEAFGFLKGLNARLNLYKICSTLDSSPTVGSIGKALDIARPLFAQAPVPIYPASPKMGRYQCFGTLFAKGPGGVHRLDRHPVVAHHPVTPMDEADVVRHLAKQTKSPIGRVDLPALASLQQAQSAFAERQSEGFELVAVDTVSPSDLAICGAVFWDGPDGRLVAGSQGVAEALVAWWRTSKQLTTPTEQPPIGRAKTMVAVSGSLSSVTEAQIDWAFAHGFVGVQLDGVAALHEDGDVEIMRVIAAARAILESGRTPLVYSAHGRSDPAVNAYRESAAARGITPEAANQRIGESLGRVLHKLVNDDGVERAAIAGGDSSGYALKQLDVLALTALAATAPGAGLYQAHATHPAGDGTGGLQIALKGGQMGTLDYFGRIRDGGNASSR